MLTIAETSQYTQTAFLLVGLWFLVVFSVAHIVRQFF